MDNIFKCPYPQCDADISNFFQNPQVLVQMLTTFKLISINYTHKGLADLGKLLLILLAQLNTEQADLTEKHQHKRGMNVETSHLSDGEGTMEEGDALGGSDSEATS